HLGDTAAHEPGADDTDFADRHEGTPPKHECMDSTTRSIGRSGPPGNADRGQGDASDHLPSRRVAGRLGHDPAHASPRFHLHEGATNVSSLIESLVLE